MKLFGKLFRGRDAPSNSTTGSGYGFFYGEHSFREEGERTECHADDCGVFLCEDSF